MAWTLLWQQPGTRVTCIAVPIIADLESATTAGRIRSVSKQGITCTDPVVHVV